MPNTNLRIAGRVIDLGTKRGAAELRVEAWPYGKTVKRALTTAPTDKNGAFAMELQAPALRKEFGGQRVAVYFRVLSGKKLLADTRDSIRWTPTSKRKIVIGVDIARTRLPKAGRAPDAETHEIVGRLLNQETGTPLRRCGVRGVDVDAEPNQELGYDITDPTGLFSLAYTVPRNPSGKTESGRAIRLYISDPAGREIHQVLIDFKIGQRQILEVRVPSQSLPQPSSEPISELATKLGIEVPAPLLQSMSERGVRTLDDIRRKGGLSRIDGLAVPPDHPAVKTLEAHARLSTLSRDPEIRAALIEKEITHPLAIARMSRSRFVQRLSGTTGDLPAALIHTTARAQVNVLNNMLIGFRAAQANGYTPYMGKSSVGPGAVQQPDWWSDVAPPGPCSCKDCEAAVSPLAYLADLLDYALTHVKDDDVFITLAWLTKTFYQPFGDLPAACEEMEKKVRQVRICIEILRRYLKDHPATAAKKQELETAEGDYRLTAYTVLLTKIGTAYEEIRLARSGEAEERKKLADRLGIDLSPEHPDELDALFFEPESIAEAALEKLFGLVDTTRYPLDDSPLAVAFNNFTIESYGGAGQDKTGPVTVEDGGATLHLVGNRWKKISLPYNLTPNTVLEFDFKSTVQGDVHGIGFDVDVGISADRTFQLYGTQTWGIQAFWNYSESPATTKHYRIAVGQFYIGQMKYVTFTMDHDVASPTGESIFSNVRIYESHPQFLAWRLAHLRTVWKEQDFPENPAGENLLPIIDPDLIGVSDLKNPDPGDAAYELWKQRKDWLDAELTALKSSSKDLGGFDAIVQTTLGVTATDLVNLAEQEKEGESIATTLEQWKLARDAFLYLLRIRRLLTSASPVPVLDSEWEDVHSILLQVKKRQNFANWRLQEETKNIPLGPDHFQIPGPPEPPEFPLPEPKKPPAWRGSWRDRRDWEEKLQSRIDQEAATIQAVHEAVSATEEETLPGLRDALIRAIAKPTLNASLENKAKWVIDYLLIDAKADGCQMTTRIAQAIEAIQLLLWSLRTGQLKDTYAELELVAEDFAEEWEWIGSYATWRAAMFVFLYPENILMPTLRRKTTPAFRKLVEAIRQNRRLTPENACEAARTYSDYFRDVCTLTVEATCPAETRIYQGEGCDKTAAGYSPHFYMFGRGKATKSVYWSAYDLEDESGYAQSFWDTVPGLNNSIEIVGAVPYKMTGDQRHIFLFVFTLDKGERKLVFSRYDLERQIWDAEPTELELPSASGACQAVAVQRPSDDEPPEIAFYCGGFYPFVRALNAEGSGWSTLEGPSSSEEDAPEGEAEVDDEWLPFLIKAEIFATTNRIKQLHAVVQTGTLLWGNERQFCYTDDNGVLIVTKLILLVVAALPFENSSFVGAVPWDEDESYFFYRQGNTTHARLYTASAAKDASIPITAATSIGRDSGSSASTERCIIFHRKDTQAGLYRARISWENEAGTQLKVTDITRANPYVTGAFDVGAGFSDEKLAIRQILIQIDMQKNADGPESNLTYLREAYYFVPIFLGLELQKRGGYIAALDWFRTVYNYSAPIGQRKIYYGLVDEESLDSVFERADNWLLDPLDPHAVAATRRNAQTRFTLLTLARCFLGYGNSEFTRDTAESVARARTLYLTALELLDEEELKQELPDCGQKIGELIIEIGDPQSIPMYYQLKQDLARISNVAALEAAIQKIQAALSAEESLETRFCKARKIVAEAVINQPPPPTFTRVLDERVLALEKAHTALLTQDSVALAADHSASMAANDFRRSVFLVSGNSTESLPWLWGPVASDSDTSGIPGSRFRLLMRSHVDTLKEAAARAPAEAQEVVSQIGVKQIQPPSYQFCIPPNPAVQALRLQAELNLYKIRTCRNIAGVERELEPYAAPTDTITGLPMIGVGGQLVLPGVAALPPTQYRYATLIERSKQLVQIAAQIEAAMLSAIEKRDAEYYNRLQARQHAQLARQSVRLQDLRLKEAQDGIRLAELQRDRADIQVKTYQEWIDQGLSQWEELSLTLMEDSAAFQFASAITSFVAATLPSGFAGPVPEYSPQGSTSAVASGLSSLAAATSTAASIIATLAHYERRQQEWELQKSLAQQDFLIGEQQVKIAQDQVRVVGQERHIAEMQAEHANDTLEFLANKFTNVELYDWMGDVLEGVFSFFLQQATAMAKLAEYQLAFERQEIPPAFIQADYWEAPAGMEIGGDPHTGAPDRRGLTGSARLLQDIHQLDQYAFETDKRKLQLTKTISLVQLSPAEFQRFRETGLMTFGTPMELFDRDFPGHYLRLIKRVRTSVIALIPPAMGVHATLTMSGPSRVVIGSNGTFQEVQVKRAPESVALSAPINASGLFDLTPQLQEMLNPFEGNGVGGFWELRMPKASNLFDYRTLADVLVTIEYTALDSFDYRQQVIQELDTMFSADRLFSFRRQFADQWYDLHNPEQTTTPMTVKFTTRPQDFPPNLDDLKIQHALLYFARKADEPFEVEVTHLHFTEQNGGGSVGGGATSISGIISTRKGNGGGWTAMVGHSPFGEWELALPETIDMKNRFKDEEVEDILFVITYSGRTPEWPK